MVLILHFVCIAKAQLPSTPLMLEYVNLEMSNILCDSTLPSGEDCTDFHNNTLTHPLQLQVIEEDFLYSAEAYFGNINDAQGYLVQKLSLITGEVSWQQTFNFSNSDSLYLEKPIGLYVFSDNVVIISFQKPTEYNPNDFNIPLQFYQFFTNDVNLIRRTFERDNGELISEDVILASSIENGVNGDSEYSQGLIPINEDQFLLLNRVNNSDSLDLGFEQIGLQFAVGQSFPLANLTSLNILSDEIGATAKTFGYNYFYADQLIFHYEKVENTTSSQRFILIEIFENENPISNLLYSYQLEVDEDIFDNAIIKYADEERFIIQVVDIDFTKYYLVQNDGTILNSFRIMHDDIDLNRVVFTSNPMDDTIVGMGSSIDNNLSHLIFCSITENEIVYTDTIRFTEDFYRLTPSNIKFTEENIFISGQYEFIEENDIKEKWITNFAINKDIVSSVYNEDFFKNLLVYPNPVQENNILSLRINSLSQRNLKYEVLDQIGRRIIVSDLLSNEIDVSSLGLGMFVIKIYSEEGYITAKFIKH